KERIKRQIYRTRDDAKSDVFDYIEGFYNRVRRHSHLDLLSPLAFEQQAWHSLGTVAKRDGDNGR
ncbi:MAG TPA: IS3 family transposase, partial [Polaromonas sp.]|uniref:IS3 family transposase n=1 Tax=Polaromonas sp. TaxID=1869339 RepID=UPI002D54F13E